MSTEGKAILKPYDTPEMIAACLECRRADCQFGTCPRIQALGHARTGRGTGKPGRRYEAFGRSQTLTEWAAEVDLPRSTLESRIKAGIPVERALTMRYRARPDGCHARLPAITIDGVTDTVKGWAARLNVGYQTILWRRTRSHLTAESAVMYYYARRGETDGEIR